MGLGRHAELPQGQHYFTWTGRPLLHLQLHRPAHHHVGQRLLISVLGFHGADIFAFAQNGDTVGHLHDLVELMGDEQDGFSLLSKFLHRSHQLPNFLGREHGSRLIKN